MWAEETLAQSRYNVCKSCDRFISLTRLCRECGCFMPLKTKFQETVCPLKKWNEEESNDGKN
jgi:hypothetical protein